jgi:hypothetical protein
MEVTKRNFIVVPGLLLHGGLTVVSGTNDEVSGNDATRARGDFIHRTCEVKSNAEKRVKRRGKQACS